MAKWAVVVAGERFSQERLYASQFAPGAGLPAGDEALLVAALDPPVVFGVARADAEGRLRYTVDLIDAPLPFAATLEPGAHLIDEAVFAAVTSAAGPSAASLATAASAVPGAGSQTPAVPSASQTPAVPLDSKAPAVSPAMGAPKAFKASDAFSPAADAPGAFEASDVPVASGAAASSQASTVSAASGASGGSGAGGVGGKRTWLVSVDLPIEAASPAEAVREFWAYVRDLGPAELPAFVWPAGDELAMQAFVLGVEANQDPEED